MSGNEAWNRNVFRRRRKVDTDGADITLSGRLLQMVGPATVCSMRGHIGLESQGFRPQSSELLSLMPVRRPHHGGGGLHNLQNCLDLMDLQLSRERHWKL